MKYHADRVDMQQGERFPDEMIEKIKNKATLKQEVRRLFRLCWEELTPANLDVIPKTLLDDCADMYISVTKNTSLTGQEIQIGNIMLLSLVSLGLIAETMISHAG